MYKKLIGAAALATALVGAMPAMAAVVIADASFEAPATGSYIYGTNPGFVAPAGTIFAGPGSGVQRNGSAWGFAAAPGGVQTAFLQNVASISLSVTGLSVGTIYSVGYWASQRSGYQLNPITTSWNGSALAAALTPTSTSWASYTGGTFVAGATSGLLSFSTNLSGGDHDSGIDLISLTAIGAVPEASSWLMMIAGFGLVGASLRRRAAGALRFA